MSNTIATPNASHAALAREIVLLPGDEHWDRARQAYNLAVDQQPEAIVIPRDVADVADAVRFAAVRGVRVAAQRTGHAAAPLGSLANTVLVRTDHLQGVRIDTARRTAWVRAGTRWRDIVPSASEYGLAGLHGTALDVSVVGHSLAGGLGWYGRRYGLAANRITAAEIVTADGEVRQVDRDHDAELFWALRGGGGNFGIVTALEFELLPIRSVYAGALVFPWAQAHEALRTWHEWVPGVPDELTSVGRVVQFPNAPGVPEPMRGNAFAIVEAVFVGDEREGEALLAPLRALKPMRDTFAQVPPAAIGGLHMDSPEPVAYMAEHQLVSHVPGETVDDLVAIAGPESESPILSFELRHLGGALARGGADHGALSTLAGSFAAYAAGLATDPEAVRILEAHFSLLRDVLVPYDAGSFMNFTERCVNPSRFFPPRTLARLQAVKRDVDPGRIFHANHSIVPAR